MSSPQKRKALRAYRGGLSGGPSPRTWSNYPIERQGLQGDSVLKRGALRGAITIDYSAPAGGSLKGVA